MRSPASFKSGLVVAARRLHALSPLDAGAADALREAAQRTRVLDAHHELLTEGKPITEAYLVLEGWGARIRQLADGRRAILNFLLPGDLTGHCDQDHPVASSTVVAITRLVVCPAPPRDASPMLAKAYAVSRALEEAHLLNQITRLSRLTAYERMADLFLELLERLELAGQVTGGGFNFPVTQEIVADVLGLSTVHVNRTLQQARAAGHIRWSGKQVQILDPAGLAQSIGRQPVRVTV